MKLHEAIEAVLREAGRPLHVSDIARAIGDQDLYRRGDGGAIPTAQIHARVATPEYSDAFVRLGDGVINLAARDAAPVDEPDTVPDDEPATASATTVSEVVARHGAGAAKWVWTAKPFYAFEADGRDRKALEPVPDPMSGDVDERGWWTCHPQTKAGDLAVVYRSETPANEPGSLPRRGPKNLRQVVLALTNAFPLASDPLAGEFTDKHGCEYMPVGAFSPPISIDRMRDDPILSLWPALAKGFIGSASEMPEPVWRRLVELDLGHRDGPVKTRRVSITQRRRVEHLLEQWLSKQPSRLDNLAGERVELVGTQITCGDGHGGVMDILLRGAERRSKTFVVLELKADDIRRDAIAQALGYMGWLSSMPGARDVRAVVIGLDAHPQVSWVLDMVDGVTTAHWNDLALPERLAEALAGVGTRD